MPIQAAYISVHNHIRQRTGRVRCRSTELSGIKLRRSEKRLLNGANNAAGTRYHLMDPAKPTKPLARVSTPAHKIFVLVRRQCWILSVPVPAVHLQLC